LTQVKRLTPTPLQGGVGSRSGVAYMPATDSGLDVDGLPDLRPASAFVVLAFVAGFLEVVLQLLLGVPPALADGPHLLGGGCSVGVLVRTKVAWISSA
jgi:hypothetical protein